MATMRDRPLLCWIIKVPRSRSTSAMRNRTASPSRKPVQYSTRISVRSIEAPDEAALVGRGRGQDPAHLVVAEDVGQEDRFLDRRQGVFRHMARRIAAAAVQAQLADDAELVAHA